LKLWAKLFNRIMAADVLVKYKNFPALEIALDDNSLKHDYKNLLKKNSQHPSISRDPCKYTLEYFSVLTQQAKDILKWDWIRDQYSLNELVNLHKDIEVYLANGFKSIAKEHDELLHELHYALHAIGSKNSRGKWIQVEWFNDDGFQMPNDLIFSTQLEFGDVKLQNPYVGHDPIFVYRQRDFSSIGQTCKFHDLVRPGINIMIRPDRFVVTDFYRTWYNTHAPDWIQQNGWDKIIRYTGWPRVGRVKNLDVLKEIAISPLFEIESIDVL
jgi:hypothetical protein